MRRRAEYHVFSSDTEVIYEQAIGRHLEAKYIGVL